MKKILLSTALIACMALAAGPVPAAEEMTVSAAASLTDAFTELKGLFEKSHPGLTVNVNFAASNPLLKQLQEGAPVDVFATADLATMDKAAAAKVIDAKTRRNFALNDLVLIVPKGSAPITKIADLAKCGRIAIGNPDSVPAGRYARASLTAAGLWEKLSAQYIQGTNVRQVLDYVARGEVDAGIVYGTDAKKQAGKVAVSMVLEGHEPVLYPIAVATTGRNAKMGQAFADFVLSPEGQAVLAKHGFAKP